MDKVNFICSVAPGTGIPVSLPPGGPIIPGTGTPEGAKAYCDALKKRYKEMQDDHNTEENAEKAKECSSSGWDPEDEEQGSSDDFSDCPNFFPFPIPGTAAPGTDPGSILIPDCFGECSCSDQ
jgi:hypothetical protein